MSKLPHAFVLAAALVSPWLTTSTAFGQEHTRKHTQKHTREHAQKPGLREQDRQEQDSRTPTTLLEIGSGKLTLEAHWAQIADSTYKLHEKATAFRFQPAAKRKDYSAEAFRGFLSNKPVKMGSTWRLSPGVYREFLKQFHSGVQVTSDGRGMRVAGGWACLRAISKRFAEVMIRVHADFEMRKGEAYYNPAQFAGTLILDRKQKQVVGFRLALPARNSNADIVAKLKGRRWMSADIVYVPRMELVGGHLAKDLEWDREISAKDARQRLAKRFYRFVNIDWVPFDRAQAESKRTGRPMHLMVLFGTLDDESC